MTTWRRVAAVVSIPTVAMLGLLVVFGDFDGLLLAVAAVVFGVGGVVAFLLADLLGKAVEDDYESLI